MRDEINIANRQIKYQIKCTAVHRGETEEEICSVLTWPEWKTLVSSSTYSAVIILADCWGEERICNANERD